MGEAALGKAMVENGIGAGMAIVVAILLFSVVKHVLQQQQDILAMAKEQNSEWRKVVAESTAQSKEAFSKIHEAHDHQREEHKKMIAVQEQSSQAIALVNANLENLNASLTSKN